MDADTIRRIEEAVARREDARSLWRAGKTAVEMDAFRDATDDLCDELLEHVDDLLAAAKRAEKYEKALHEIDWCCKAAEDEFHKREEPCRIAEHCIAREALGPEENET